MSPCVAYFSHLFRPRSPTKPILYLEVVTAIDEKRAGTERSFQCPFYHIHSVDIVRIEPLATFTSRKEVELAIIRPNNKKASDSDGIWNFILRKWTPTITEHFFNNCLNNGHFSLIRLIPISKKLCSSDFKDMKSNSFLSNIGKILERISTGTTAFSFY